MEELIQKYQEAKTQMVLYEKKIQKYRKKIEEELQKQNLTKYENDVYVIHNRTQQRFMIHKKDVPETVWKEYAKPQQISFLCIREKIKTPK